MGDDPIPTVNPASVTPGTPARPTFPVPANPGVSDVGTPAAGGNFFRPEIFTSPTGPSAALGSLPHGARNQYGASVTSGAGAAAMAMLAGSTAAIPSSTSGKTVNATAVYARLPRIIGDKVMEATQHYQMMFTKKDGKRNRMGDFAREYTMFNLPAWNAWRARSERRAAAPEDVPTAEEAFKDWYFDGFVRSQDGGEYQQGHDAQRHRQRELNLVVHGECYTFNFWAGQNVRPLTRLFLIVKMVDIPDDTEYVVNPAIGILSPHSDANPDRSRKAFQIFPYANFRHYWPPDDEVMYEDPFGRMVPGKVICIGRMGTTFDAGSDTRAGTSHLERSIVKIASQASVVVYLDARG
jgi:hypothetical protein